MKPGTVSPPRDADRVRGKTILVVFLWLGCTSFGGPIAHLGYFRDEFVMRRRWLEESQFAEIIALAQTLPGPASSQVGFTIGMLKGGLRSALAAWTGFTLPSGALMTAFGFAHRSLVGPHTSGVIHGLQIVAVAVIAQAVLLMQQTLAPDRIRASIAALGAGIALLAPSYISTIGAIGAGALMGAIFCRAFAHSETHNQFRAAVSKASAALALCVFVVLLLAPPLFLARTNLAWLALVHAFYRSGAWSSAAAMSCCHCSNLRLSPEDG